MANIDLISPWRTFGNAVGGQDLPPIAEMYLGTFLRNRGHEVHIHNLSSRDGLENLCLFDQREERHFVGLSTWLTNADPVEEIGNKVRQLRPRSKIIVGGVHTEFLSENILRNQKQIDYVMVGPGEAGMLALAEGMWESAIPGLVYREGPRKIVRRESDYDIPLVRQAIIDPRDWFPNYSSTRNPTMQSHDGFPLRDSRGCYLKTRCGWCVIPGLGLDVMPPELFWKQVQILDACGEKLIFMTGDVMPYTHFKQRIKARPDGLKDMKFRGYLLPFVTNEGAWKNIVEMGVWETFIGYEGVHVYGENPKISNVPGGDPAKAILDEAGEIEKRGVRLMPSFMVGGTRYTKDVFRRNADVMKHLAIKGNVHTIALSMYTPLPGSELFEYAMESEKICDLYENETGHSLSKTDQIRWNSLHRHVYDEISIELGRDGMGYDELIERTNTLTQELKELGVEVPTWDTSAQDEYYASLP